MAVGAAGLGGETGDALRVHQRGVGRGQFVGEDDGTLGHARIGGVGLFDQVADQPRADDADVLGPRREIGVAHRGKAARDLVDFELDGALGVDALMADPLAGAAHQARVRQHRDMRVEQVADLLGGGFGEAGSLGLELAQLFERGVDRLGKAGALGLDLGLGDVALMDREVAALDQVSGADGDARRHAEAGQALLAGVLGGAGRFCQLGRLVRPRRLVNPH